MLASGPADGGVADADGGANLADASFVPDSQSDATDAAAQESDAALGPDAATDNESDASVEADAGAHDASAPAADAAQPSCALTFYRDADLDGYGDPAAPITACSKPTGYVVNSADCYDANKLARPGQTGSFSEHRGDGSFDYNCNGVVDLRDAVTAQCPADIATATCPPWPSQHGNECDYDAQVAPWRTLQEGWYGQVPACGQIAKYGVQINWDNGARTFSCSAPTTTQQQSCR